MISLLKVLTMDSIYHDKTEQRMRNSWIRVEHNHALALRSEVIPHLRAPTSKHSVAIRGTSVERRHSASTSNLCSKVVVE